MKNELLECFKKQELDQKRLNMNYYENMPLEKFHYTYYIKSLNKDSHVRYDVLTVLHEEMLELSKTHKFCKEQEDNNSMFPKIEKI